jgi:hypothetical protein
LNTAPTPPVVARWDVPKLQAAVHDVLTAHGFPATEALQTSAGALWISPRPSSATEVVLARVTAGETLTVVLTGFARVGNDWAVLGQLFTERLRQEEREMEKGLRDKIAR